MKTDHNNLQPNDILTNGAVIPVIVIHHLEDAVPLAEALVAGGIKVMEITLRTPVALEAIKLIGQEVKEAIVGAGTVASPKHFIAAEEAGAAFASSPGITPALLDTAKTRKIAYIPGIATISELMMGMDEGLRHFKFFPAEPTGGINMLMSIYAPFPQVMFYASGGISPGNYREYLQLPNVVCIGGSWLASPNVLADKNWAKVTEMAQHAIANANQV